MRAGLAPAVTGASVTSVAVFDERSLRRHDGPSEDFVERLVGAVLGAPQRRGKYLWLPLGGQMQVPARGIPGFSGEGVTQQGESPAFGTATALVVHLGMSGQVLLRDQARDDGPRRR